MNSHLPTSAVTFLFTDIESSTLLWEKQPEVMKTALAQQDALPRKQFNLRAGMDEPEFLRHWSEGCRLTLD